MGERKNRCFLCQGQGFDMRRRMFAGGDLFEKINVLEESRQAYCLGFGFDDEFSRGL